MGAYSVSFNTLVDAQNNHKENIPWLKAKIADLEDRSRRNNLKITGVPGSATGAIHSYPVLLLATIAINP